MISSVSTANLMRISHREKEKQGSIIRPSACQGHICAAEAETLDRHRTHDRGSQEDDGAERFAILHHQRRDQHELVSSQAGMQPPGTYSLSTHYGLRPEREGLHLVLQLRSFVFRMMIAERNDSRGDQPLPNQLLFRIKLLTGNLPA